MKSFNEIYSNIYNESHDVLEQERMKVRNNIFTSIVIFTIIGLVLVIITNNFAWLIFSLAMILVSTLLFLSTQNKYRTMFKERVIRAFVREYSEKLEYIPQRGVSSMSYVNAEFERFDRFKSEDLIIGSLENGHRIHMSEVLTEDRHEDDEGHVSYTTLFHGLFAEIELDKYVNSNIKIRKDMISLFGNKLKIEMDSDKFEKSFNVYATDKIIAMQLLTSDVMQMLLDFEEQTKLTPEITIKHDKMYIRCRTGEIFEANILKKSLDFDTLLKYYNIINFSLNLTEQTVKNIQETEL